LDVTLQGVQITPINGRGVAADDRVGLGYFMPALVVRTVIDERFHVKALRLESDLQDLEDVKDMFLLALVSSS
jgi:hypothetical protein